jgi:two-component system, NarL family, nitrate/nitrite response regulator NarL
VTQVVTTILVDSDSLFREGLRRILGTTVFRVAKPVAAIDDIPPRSLQGSRALLILVGTDVDHAAAAVAVGRLKAKNPTARVVVLTDHCSLEEFLMLLRAGVDGYLLKQISCDALIKALDLVMLGVTTLAGVNCILGVNEAVQDEDPEPAAPANVVTLAPTSRPLSDRDAPANVVTLAATSRPLFDRATPANVVTLAATSRPLSDREAGILHCLMRGDANKTIARQLNVTEATVKVHIKAILRKICVRNRTQAAVWAHNHLFDPTFTAHASIAKSNGHADSH